MIFTKKYVIQKVELSYESFYLLLRKELNAWGGVFSEKHKEEDEKKECFNTSFKKENIFLVKRRKNLV